MRSHLHIASCFLVCLLSCSLFVAQENMDHGPDPEGSDDRWIAEQNDYDQLMDLTKQFSSDWEYLEDQDMFALSDEQLLEEYNQLIAQSPLTSSSDTVAMKELHDELDLLTGGSDVEQGSMSGPQPQGTFSLETLESYSQEQEVSELRMADESIETSLQRLLPRPQSSIESQDVSEPLTGGSVSSKPEGSSYSIPGSVRSCCKVRVSPAVTRSKVHTVTFSCTRYYSFLDYIGCGWWSRCARYRTRSRIATCYSQVTTYYRQPAQNCPADQDICCEKHFPVFGYCLNRLELEIFMSFLRSSLNTNQLTTG